MPDQATKVLTFHGSKNINAIRDEIAVAIRENVEDWKLITSTKFTELSSLLKLTQ